MGNATINLLGGAEDDAMPALTLATDTPPTTVQVFELLLEVLNEDTGDLTKQFEEKLNAAVRDMIRLNLTKKDRYRRLMQSTGLWNGYKFTRPLTAEEAEALRTGIGKIHTPKDAEGAKMILFRDDKNLLL